MFELLTGDVLLYLLAGAAVMLAVIAMKLKAPLPKGAPPHSSFRPFWGATLDMQQRILTDKVITPPEWYAEEIKRNGFRAFAWGHMGGKSGVTIVEPEDVKFLLKDNFNNFVKGGEFVCIFDDLLGDGIFNVNGTKWKEQRTVAAHMFNRRQLRERMSTVFGLRAQEVVQILQQKGTLDIQSVFYHYAFDCINSVAFNRDVNSLRGNERDCEYQTAFDGAQSKIITRFFVPWWRVNKMLKSSETEKSIADNIETINAYVGEVVDSYFNENGNVKDEALVGDQTMTGLFLEHAKTEGMSCSKRFIRDMIINFGIAGRDTTGGSLTSSIEFLCKHPEWQEKLIEEAKACFGGNTQEPLTFDDIEGKSPVAEAVLLEALRLQPSVPWDEKHALKTTTFPSGVVVEAGEDVSWLPWMTNRYKKVWGEDAEEFKPTRWMDGKAAKYDDFMYPTFNAGPRMCLGKNMAILEGKIALLTLFAHFRFAIVPGFTPKLTTSVTWQLDSNGLQVVATPL